MFKPKGVMLLTLVIMLMAFSCSGPESDQPLLTAELPLHLEEHIEAARIEGSEVPEDILPPVEWRFDEPQPDWKPIKPVSAQIEAIKPVRVEDALRLPLTGANRSSRRELAGGIYVALPDWNPEDWAYVEIRVRTRDPMLNVSLVFNYTEENPQRPPLPFYSLGRRTWLVTDGMVQTYRLSLDLPNMRRWEGPWTDLGLWFISRNDPAVTGPAQHAEVGRALDGKEAVTLDILSVRVIPKEYIYAGAPVGVRTDERNEAHRHTLYTHAPGRIKYRVRVPQAGRLDVGLGVLREDVPVTFRIVASQKDEEEVALFEETYANQKEWGQRTIDLSSYAGKTVRIALEVDAKQSGAVAIWTAPTISGIRMTQKPNIIFYVISGAGADWMSVYGYNRRTTPFLEELAREGALFEHAYSNGTWTKVSTPSFMTSLLYSVLGGYRYFPDKIPKGVTTMAEHLGHAGYTTAVITSTSFAVTMSGLERGVDEVWVIDPPVNAESSQYLHRAFWEWRMAYPGEPYWVHLQTNDVYEDFMPTAPFFGLFFRPELVARYIEWEDALWEFGSLQPWKDKTAFAKIGITREEYALAQQALYDECMAQQDHQLRRLVERLKAEDEWKNTLLIVASDSGYPAGSHRLMEPMEIDAPYFHPFATRIPLMFILPGRIQAGVRFSDPVSMIDVLPTVLELAGLPMPEIMQGQSLVPLLLDEGEWKPRPVIIDMIAVEYTTGHLIGSIEVIDGRWGASLCINPVSPGKAPPARGYVADGLTAHYERKEELALYDLWNDPVCTKLVNEEHPGLVEKYRTLLEEQLRANEMLLELIGSGGTVELTPEQLELLRSLGYIR